MPTRDNVVNGLDINLMATNWLHKGSIGGIQLNYIAGGGGSNVAGVPEPSSLLLMAMGMAGIGYCYRRRKM